MLRTFELLLVARPPCQLSSRVLGSSSGAQFELPGTGHGREEWGSRWLVVEHPSLVLDAETGSVMCGESVVFKFLYIRLYSLQTVAINSCEKEAI